MKKIMLLGGLRYIIPVIKSAHEQGIHVITCDNIPENIAHKYSDEYYNINIIDKYKVLDIAQKLNIDGILSFAVDPGVIPAAFVADFMGLHGLPLESVKILQNKGLFRKFLTDNRFNVPFSKSFSSTCVSEVDLEMFNFPLIVKPVDSAGSKGVTKINNIKQLPGAIATALKYSLSKEYIIEDFIQKKGYSSDSDCFSVNGELKFVSFSNQYFDDEALNPFTPSAYSWPSSISIDNQNKLTSEIQRLIKLLNLGTSIYNVETREGLDGKVYIMEVSPRGGGNRLAEMLKYSTGVDLIKNAINASLGEINLDVFQTTYNGYWAEIILHSNKNGIFRRLNIDPIIKKNNLIELDLWVESGDAVKSFNAANDTIGTIILRFDTLEEQIFRLNNQSAWLDIIID